MSASPPQLQALVFDAYGTLYDVASVTALCDKHFPGHGVAISDIWRQKQLEYTWLSSLMGRYQDFWQLTAAGLRFACGSLKLEPTEEAFRELMENYLQLTPYAEVPGALQALSQRIPLAILSNGSPEMLLKVTQHNGFTPYLKHVLSVHELSVFKPSPQVYELAVEKLGVPRESIGFVSSNSWDAVGAKAFGFHVFWINRFGRYQEQLGVTPDHEIHRLDEIAPLLST
ncbi:MAG TPA: haloacid dehalogenase type II [bacterium]|nr:haloacid dehalogenase type II [bacterium]